VGALLFSTLDVVAERADGGGIIVLHPRFWAVEKLSESFLLGGKFLSKSANFGTKKPPFWKHLWAKLKL